MRPYGRRPKIRNNLHNEWCLVCYPPTKSASWHGEPYAIGVIKARDRRAGRREIKEWIDDLTNTSPLWWQG